MMRASFLSVCTLACVMGALTARASTDVRTVDWQFSARIPMRDGVALHATIYRPRDVQRTPCIFTLTPYIAQTYHERAKYFAAHGYAFLTVDSRGRGNSDGQFAPFIQEARDGYDVVEWLARQPFCNRKVAMWGGSYGGYDQWSTASQRPPHLSTIVPAASTFIGVDFPSTRNIMRPYAIQWLTQVSGRTLQLGISTDEPFWTQRFRAHFLAHGAFADLDSYVGNPSPVFQEWARHPHPDSYIDKYNPTDAQYAAMDLPILTITGQFDSDQAGALEHYRRHLANAGTVARERHFLLIGPWNHAQTRTPSAQVGGLALGVSSVLDLNDLHRQWYDWTMKDGPQPEFLRGRVAYYVTGADLWRYRDTLEAVTQEHRPLYLTSQHGSANDVFRSGSLSELRARDGQPHQYVYDPLDVRMGEIEASIDAESLREQRGVLLADGRSLVYHSAPFPAPTEITGFFRLNAWIAMDQPDTDFSATVYEIAPDGSSLYLSSAVLRARYRESARREKLVPVGEVIEYVFDNFTFTARRIGAGSRLRFVLGPVNSIFAEKNYNSGDVVARETARDARTVTVRLFNGERYPSALYVPIGAPQ